MKLVYVNGICCKGCAKELEGIFKNIYGIKNVEVSVDSCTVKYEGYVSKKVILEALEGTKYTVEKIVSE
ncbi:MAG: heavy-metal-associated domain-containing protein [Candidatus Izemoplasmatales bacterium]|jgi:copper chaperone CopZ|nr:heavy-metal-associated domain-containing protein [Candidatus Izemoplasmatales bacterium]MDD4069179.1 heavy-metal-associated domain-containing protein [Candidatus Izemoplasmatales bacterium]MDY0138850.1 heavy-metal-associated domain-containing protein [Candidatus Izemoplasmatales bacterium]